jgi:PTS system nitrogen regulatory IIA component
VKICDILKQPLLLADLRAGDKEGVLREMSEHLSIHAKDVGARAEDVLAALLNRERLGSTGVGEGVAIPHAKISGLKSLVACFGRTVQGVPFDAIDYQPVRLIFVLLVPENSAGAHLKALARISRLLKNPAFRERLLTLGDADALYRAFCEEDDPH